jgi:hypothetical protein
MEDNYDYCYECMGYGDNYIENEDGELECYCPQCPKFYDDYDDWND